MTTTTDRATLALTDDALAAAALHLHERSALAYCTELTEPDDDGTVHIRTVRPLSWLSTGERALWEALGVLAGECGVFDLDNPHLDAGNRVALAEAAAMCANEVTC